MAVENEKKLGYAETYRIPDDEVRRYAQELEITSGKEKEKIKSLFDKAGLLVLEERTDGIETPTLQTSKEWGMQQLSRAKPNWFENTRLALLYFKIRARIKAPVVTLRLKKTRLDASRKL